MLHGQRVLPDIRPPWFDFDCQQIGHNVQQLCNTEEKDGDGDEAV